MIDRDSSDQVDATQIPKIYAFSYGEFLAKPWKRRSGGLGWIKVGYTTKVDVWERIREQTSSSVPSEIKLLWEESAISERGESFRDTRVHQRLIANGAHQVHNEWFEATVDELKIAIAEVKQGRRVTAPESFAMRPEQRRQRRKPSISCGMQKCDLERRLPRINWHWRWAGRSYWSSHTNQQLKIPGGVIWNATKIFRDGSL